MDRFGLQQVERQIQKFIFTGHKKFAHSSVSKKAYVSVPKILNGLNILKVTVTTYITPHGNREVFVEAQAKKLNTQKLSKGEATSYGFPKLTIRIYYHFDE